MWLQNILKSIIVLLKAIIYKKIFTAVCCFSVKTLPTSWNKYLTKTTNIALTIMKKMLCKFDFKCKIY